MVELLVIANDGPVEMPIAVAVAAHVQLKRLPKGWWVEPIIEERCWELLDRARLDAGLPPVRRGRLLRSTLRANVAGGAWHFHWLSRRTATSRTRL